MSRRAAIGALLGGRSARTFLAGYWQKRPLLVRAALSDAARWVDSARLLELATRDAAQSRLIRRQGNRWTLEHGPFALHALRRLPARDWTVLVQDVNHFVPAADALLKRFDFVPRARIDDVMVSYATTGGGVGPHYDSYDVFLVQGHGRRCWRLSGQKDLGLRPGLPLKILAHFKPDEEHVLGPGDMLYLPPGWCHDGVALEPCITYSVGFRAATYDELKRAFLAYLDDTLTLEGQYRDANLTPVRHAGELPSAMVQDATRVLAKVRWSAREVERFLGMHLSEPKAHVFFDPPKRPLSLTAFAGAAMRRGVRLDAKSRMHFTRRDLFLNGEACAMRTLSRKARHVLRTLADRCSLAPMPVPADAAALLHAWYRAGYLQLGAP